MFNGIPTMMKYAARSPYQCGPSGFSFDNCLRLMENGILEPNRISTGTTIAAMIFDGGVVIGAESRAINAHIIPSSNSRKIYELQPNIFAGGAGVAQDACALMEVTHAQLELHSMNTGDRMVPVCCANQTVRQLLYRFSGNMQVNVIIGGVDGTGTHLFCTRFDGTADSCPFSALGSGHLAAMGILESRWTEYLDEEDARSVIADAVAAGMENDLNSGGRVTLCVIRCDFSVSWEVHAPYKEPLFRPMPPQVKLGCTAILSSIQHKVVPWGEAPDGYTDVEGLYRRQEEYLGPPKAKKRRLDPTS
ncbi:proteasome subunit beta type-7 isoform X2 [Drosophila eugracilis]|uniref:proteasome subunit beta type-7 isoform X2 n=1 Tax=Drosophila eugracilis TaxID=29029 RepID=UPI001BDAE9B1|nr:proteasome subunit beta type-7 isoform X2 [Drosophila eugracilis]